MVKLTYGPGSPTTGGCWMVACNIYSQAARVGWKQAIDEHWNDAPDDVCPVIRHLAIAINDSLPDDAAREQVLGPWLCTPSGTLDGALVERRRWYVVDHAVRVWAPLALEAEGLREQADMLRALPRVTTETASHAARAARAAASNAVAAAYAHGNYAADEASAAYASASHAAFAAAYGAVHSAAARAAAVVYIVAADAADAAAKTEFIERYVLPVLLEMCSWSSLPEVDAERRAETERVLEQARVGQEER